jgi:hypothetical protein
MKDFDRDRIELHSSRGRAITVGIAVVIVILLSWLSHDLVPLAILIVLIWVILYIDYRLLRLRIEILQELSAEKETSRSQSEMDS